MRRRPLLELLERTVEDSIRVGLAGGRPIPDALRLLGIQPGSPPAGGLPGAVHGPADLAAPREGGQGRHRASRGGKGGGMKITRRAGARPALASLRRECMALRFQRAELANENGDLRKRLATVETELAAARREGRDMKLRLKTYRREATVRGAVRPTSTPLPGPLKAFACLELDPPRQGGM